ncbi:MAG: chloride channel protein [Phycisphaeraceae bacterium]|nr:chloride channel protein [Phycisphaeraceae bacterium]
MAEHGLLQDFLGRSAFKWVRRLSMAVVVGLAAGLAAACLEWAIHSLYDVLVGRFTHQGTAQVLQFNWEVLLMPAVGATLAGFLVHWLAHGNRGHGVDTLTHSFHRQLGHMPMRVPTVKAGGSAIVISTGGSAGPEGPIAALGAAVGSTLGRVWGVSPRERRILLLAGCAAGIGAIFRCPLGAALFATSILYREPEFESDAIVPSFVASVIGYSVYMSFWGYEGPMLAVDSITFFAPVNLIWYSFLGVVCGVSAIMFFYMFGWVERVLVPRSRLPIWATAGLGGLATGALACLVPQVMDGRYFFIEAGLDQRLFEGASLSWLGLTGLCALILVAKCLATAFTVGSGAPGGVLGPSVFIGGVAGLMVGSAGMALVPGGLDENLRQGLVPVGMAAFFAATMRSPLAAMVMIMEMTGSYGLIAPLMLACIISYIIARRHGLNREQVRTHTDSPVHAADPMINVLESWKVSELMEANWPTTVDPDTGLDEVIRRIEPGTRPVIAVARKGRLYGLISASDLSRVMESGQVASILVASDIAAHRFEHVEPDEDVYAALEAFNRGEHDAIPVFSGGRGGVWHGMFSRARVVQAMGERLGRTRSAVFEESDALTAIEPDLRLNEFLIGGRGQKQARVQRLFVPVDVLGQSLRACQFSQRYNAQVIAVEHADGTVDCPPNLDQPLKSENRLLVVVWDDAGNAENGESSGSRPE